MSNSFRYLKRHPALFTLGLLGTVLFCVVGLLFLLMLLSQSEALLTGRPFPPTKTPSHSDARSLAALMVGEFLLLCCIAWYVNMWAVLARLKRLDLMAYDVVTREMGFMAFCWSSRTAPLMLHSSLGSLTLADYPPGFRRWVNITRNANRLFLIAVGFLVIALTAVALVAFYVKGR